ncbi:MAG: phosphatidylglycerophosphatase A [Spirochaetes bacterium]|nr:phosphatidylglycerophosphatase A [Spirochaetota bacterium]MBN2771621.1 phosphatidylglycerophosphatase A [Spirochaetota bacterium]
MKRVAHFFYTGFYTGYMPFAPGTFGTLLASAIYCSLYMAFGDNVRFINMGLVLIAAYPAVLLGNQAERYFEAKDPQVVVLDEMMGYWISIFFFPFNLKIVLAAFVIFRIFDILKPWPIGSSQQLKGGLGIMIDDYIAGVFTNAVIWAIIGFSHFTGIAIF